MNDNGFIRAMVEFLLSDDRDRKRMIIITAYALGSIVLGALLLKGDLLEIWFTTVFLVWLVLVTLPWRLRL